MKKKYKRFFIITLISVLGFAIVVIAFISPIAKYLIEKNDMKFIGREVRLSSVYVNPFTGFVQLNKLKIQEFQSDSIFFSAEDLKLNVAMIKLFFGNYVIDDIVINKPVGVIFQNNKYFNFNDLIQKFSSKEKADKSETKEPVHLKLLDIKIKNGTFKYRESLIPISYFIKDVFIESPGFVWDSDTIGTTFSLTSGTGSGKIKGNLNIDLTNLNYKVDVIVKQFNLSIIEQYLKDISRDGKFSAFLNADIKSNGNFLHKDSAEVSGKISVENLHLGKDRKEDYVFFKTLSVSIKHLYPAKLIYLYDSISIENPYIKFERYDVLDNFQNLFGNKGEEVLAANSNTARFNLILEVAKYIKFLSRNFFNSNYKIGRLAVYNGNFKFIDYALNERFSAALNPINASADSIDKDHSRINARVTSGIIPYGSCAIYLSINPKDSSDFNLNYSFDKLSAASLNPYVLQYTSFALDKGIIDLNGKWNVLNGNIKSSNNILIVDPRVTNRQRQKGLNWMPMRIAMFFVRETGNAIEYEVPVSGKLDNLKLHWRDVIFDILKNILFKPLTTPYRMHVKNVEIKTESSMALNWELRKHTFNAQQSEFLKQIAKITKDNNQVLIKVFPQQYTVKEKEYILFFEAKKKYVLSKSKSKSLTEEDSVQTERMSIKNSDFLVYINKFSDNKSKYTIQEKCATIISQSIITTRLNQLNSNRRQEFLSYFKKEGVEKQVKIYSISNKVPFDGFSFYKIEYKGEMPTSLINAYRRMNQLNKQEPRSQFERRKLSLRTISN